MYKGVLKNPGPESFQNVLHRRNYDLHTHCSTTTTYSRAELFGIRHRSNCSLDYSIVPVLKSVGVFKYRGRRGGQRISQRKIPVLISYRPDIARSYLMISRTLVDINIDQQRSGKQFKLCCLNARSLKNKSAGFVCYVESCAADIITITETWLTADDTAHRVEITPPGNKLLDQPRSARVGGGTAMLLRDNIKVNKVDAGERNSFEFSEWIIKHGSFTLRTINVYRPPYSTNHPVTIRTFFAEFSTYLESIVMSPEPLLVTGDFNIHVDELGDQDGDAFLGKLESMGFLQHVDKPTHRSGHTLDLIITRQCDSVLASAPTTFYHTIVLYHAISRLRNRHYQQKQHPTGKLKTEIGKLYVIRWRKLSCA